MSDSASAVEFRTYRLSDRKWVTAVNIRHYRDIEGFNGQFESVVNETLDLLERQRHDTTSYFLIAVVDENPVGCIFLSAETPETGRVRLFYLDTSHRGTGIARKMLERIIEAASTVGFSEIRVSTFDRHHAACRLYISFGFQSSVHGPKYAFGQVMRQIDFARGLSI